MKRISTKFAWLTLWVLVALCAAMAVVPIGSSGINRAFAQTNPIVLENQNPGTSSWQYGQPGTTTADDATGQIAGYTSATSVNRGEQIAFHVSVNTPQTFRMDFYRMGWYGGLGGRLMQTVGPLSGVVQPSCPLDANTGLVECNWSKSYTLTVPTSWTTGVYAVMLTNQQNFQYHFTFVVRDDSRVATFLYQQPVLTYAAYNNWPESTPKGKSLYNYNSSGANTVAGAPRAVKVSLSRPTRGQFSEGYDNSDTSWENYLVYFLEREGYDVSYSTNIDTHINGARLLGYKAFFSTGHDEYWTKEMRDNVEAARDARVNMAFWGANNAYWQVRLEPDANGVPNRTIVAYKEASALDPEPSNALKTTLFRNVGRPEQTLIGVQYTTDNAALGILPFNVQNSASPFYANTGLTNGTQVPNMIGYEVDKLFSEYTQPISQSYTVLGTSAFTNTVGVGTVSQAVIWQHTSNAWVFGSGTMSWSWALGRSSNENAGIQQLTRNILAQLSQTSPPPPTATPGPSPTPSPIPPGLCNFPAVGVSDSFNRPDGTSLLGTWFGGIANYAVANNQLSITGAGDSIMAWNQLLGNNQEASVKIVSYNASSTAIRLALKVQDGSFGNPHILVGYLPNQNRIQILTYDPAIGFLERGSFAVTLQPGDVLGARALSNGIVTAYRNGVLVLSADISNWVNNGVGGFTGLWTTSAAGAVLDDYSAGDVACTTLSTPTPAPTATAPSIPPSQCPFPALSVSDDFNRPNGTSLQGAWFGGIANFAVANNQLSVNGTGDSLMAWNSLLGIDQEASVRIVSYNASSSAIRLFLKVADGNLGNANILVGYLPNQNRIQILTYEPGIGYLERGSYAMTLQPGDVLGARALSTGFVEAYVNSNKVLNANIAGWVNNAAGGFTGVWATSAAGAVLDNYTAGNVACTVTATPSAPTSTPGATTATPTTAGAWVYCANEVGTCSFSGTRQVRYGINGTYFIKTFTGSTPCTNAVFGDPAVGASKICEYSATALTNLALNKPATQSSVDFSGAPSRAVDGNTDGVYNNGSISHTGNQANSWWQVDLGAVNAINTIFLWNRTDCCADRLSNFYVFVSNTDLTGRTFSSIVSDASVWRYQMTGQAPTSLNIPVGVSGRYVRVQLAGSNALSLAEVQVFGGASAPVPTPTATLPPTPIPTNTPLPLPQVTSFTLINADTGQPVPGYDPIPNNATINLTTLNVPRINVRANVSGPVVSVRFGLNANTNYRIESVAPYALEGDYGTGGYVGVSPAAGTYDVSGIAFTGSNATGTSGATTTVRYVISYVANTATPTPTRTPAPPTATPTRTPIPPTSTPAPTSIPCSPPTGSAVVVTFVNNATFPVNVFWKNTNCQEVLFRSALQPGLSYGVNTFSGHVWVIRNSNTGAFVKAYTATSSNATILVR